MGDVTLFVDELIEFTNARGVTVKFVDEPFGLVSVEGLGDVAADVQQQKAPYQDGTDFVDTVLEPRYITTEFIVRGDDYDEIKHHRAYLSGVLNPKLGLGTLRYISGDVVRELKAVAESVPTFPDKEARGERWQRGLVTFVAPNPYWQDVNPTNIKLEDYVANFSFPFSFPVTFSIRGDSRTIVNSGHAPTPIKVTFRGDSVNPKITKNNTGEFIKVNRTIPEGYSLVITTDFNNKSVKIIAPDGVESNAMGYIDLDSTFFSLDVGENHLSFITEGGKPEVFIEYRNLFIGV